MKTINEEIEVNNELNPIDTKIIGRIVATEKCPNTAQSFSFWTNLDAPVGIGTIVKVESDRTLLNGSKKITYGIVTDGISYTDLDTPISDYISSEGNPLYAQSAQTERPEFRYYTAQVLKSEPEEPIQPVSIGNVHLADEAGIKKALRMDSYSDKTGIPIGVYENGDDKSPIYLDSRFLIGPEAAHFNVTGVSGLATKTSIVEFLLTSIFQHYKGDSEKENKKIATILFNVKGHDLLFLDQPADNLSEQELEIYEKLKIEPKAFDNVHYYAPYKADRVNLNTYRTNEELVHNVKPLSWGLKEIFDHVQVLLNSDDVDAKADAFLSWLQENLIDCDKIKLEYGFGFSKIRNFQELDGWFKELFEDASGINEEGNSQGKNQWRGHALPTIRKVYNRLINISTRCKGLVTNVGESNDLPWGEFEDRNVYVIDVANVIPLAQDLVFTRVVEKLREHLERGDLGVDKVIVFVDELNKYASNDGGNSYLKQTLLEISERGRYLGLILFSAQQFKSQVNKRIVGNCGTSVFGRMDMDELANQGYSVMPATIKQELTTLEKGKLLIRHPHFNQYIFVKFPRPSIMTSHDGIIKFPPQHELPFEDAIIFQFKRLAKHLNVKIKDIDIKNAISGIDEEEIIRAFNKTELSKDTNIIKCFLSMLKKKPNSSKSIEDTHSPSVQISDPYDMFGN
ncbi:MAG: ATP-binding protein [bacterium]